MKRATGKTSPSPTIEKVSIQLALSGHSFSEEALAPLDEAVHGSGPAVDVQVCWLTEKTTLAPQELFDTLPDPAGEDTAANGRSISTDLPGGMLSDSSAAYRLAASLLRIAGIAPATGEEIVWSGPVQGRIAVMAVRSETLRALESRPHVRLHHTSPLLDDREEAATGERAVSIRAEKSGLLYIKVYDGGLQFAEALRCDGEEDLRYLMERLRDTFPALGDSTLRLSGAEIPELRKRLKPYFRRIVCA